MCVIAPTLLAFIALFFVHGTVFNSVGTTAFRTIHLTILTQIYVKYATPNYLYKSPITLGRLYFVPHVLALKNVPLSLGTFQLSAERKDNTGYDILTCQHFATIKESKNANIFKISSYLPLFNTQGVEQGYKKLKTLFISNENTPNNLVLIESNGMASEGDFKLGKLIQGMTSLFYREAESTWGKPMPFALRSDYEALPFHLLHCGGYVTKFINIISLCADYIHNKNSHLHENLLIFK